MKQSLTIRKIECVLPKIFKMPGIGVSSRAYPGAKFVCSWARTPALIITVTSGEPLIFSEPLPPIAKVMVTKEEGRGHKKVAFRFTGEGVTDAMAEVAQVAKARKSVEVEDARASALTGLLTQFIDYIKQLDR